MLCALFDVPSRSDTGATLSVAGATLSVAVRSGCVMLAVNLQDLGEDHT